MEQHEHIVSSYEEELASLNNKIAKMGGLAEALSFVQCLVQLRKQPFWSSVCRGRLDTTLPLTCMSFPVPLIVTVKKLGRGKWSHPSDASEEPEARPRSSLPRYRAHVGRHLRQEREAPVEGGTTTGGSERNGEKAR
jgi:hypothetical protein